MKSALRLRRPAEFKHVRRAGKAYRHPSVLVSVCASNLPHNRYGFVVGKRLGGAVQRNRCKRRLRALMHALHESLRQGFDIVVVARPAMQGQPFAELQRILKRLLFQARIIETS